MFTIKSLHASARAPPWHTQPYTQNDLSKLQRPDYLRFGKKRQILMNFGRKNI